MSGQMVGFPGEGYNVCKVPSAVIWEGRRSVQESVAEKSKG